MANIVMSLVSATALKPCGIRASYYLPPYAGAQSCDDVTQTWGRQLGAERRSYYYYLPQTRGIGNLDLAVFSGADHLRDPEYPPTPQVSSGVGRCVASCVVSRCCALFAYVVLHFSMTLCAVDGGVSDVRCRRRRR